jgi:hypothetical protein
MADVLDWLLEGPVFVQYRTRLDLLGQTEKNKDVVAARRAMLADPQVKALVKELAAWPVRVLSGHKSAGHPLHRLVFLSDLGLRATDPGMKAVTDAVMEHQSEQGPFQILANVPVHYGGTGKDDWAWALCDAPLLVYALAKLGLEKDRRVKGAAVHLAGLVRDNGWPCAHSPELGKFRGPGRKDDPCPYANLAMLKALSRLPAWKDSPAAHTGAESALERWAKRRTEHPYMFFMGTDFCKLKAPLVWYDILHVLDVLTGFPWLRSDPRLRKMADVVASKADAQGRYTPESVWKAWDGWEFGQKKEPSRWLTLVALRALQRLQD